MARRVCMMRSALMVACRLLNETLSFFVFSFLDLLDIFLCALYKAADSVFESESKPCYCLSAKEPITGTGKILVSQKRGESKIVSLTSSKIKLDEISDTLYSRPLVVAELTRKFKFMNSDGVGRSCGKFKKRTVDGSRFTVNNTIIEMLHGKIRRPDHLQPTARWSDCDCVFCAGWAACCKESLYVKVQGPSDNKQTQENVLFIHGFISSSAFWTETLFPNFSDNVQSAYRLFAVDLLGFGRSPKPFDSLYTLRDHLEMIEKSVINQHKVKSFHIVAHSLGCILALALAVRHPGCIKSLTLLAPPYYPVPKGEQATQYVMRKVAPRKVWPPIAFGASMACWYEHISRTICLLICKNHRIWEFLAKLVTRNRIRTFLLEGFFCHTHNAAWHTLHNIICGTGSSLDRYLDIIRDNLTCTLTILHGRDDEVIPVECSYNLQRRIPRARIKVVDNKDHITIVVGRQKAFARELEEIWNMSSFAK